MLEIPKVFEKEMNVPDKTLMGPGKLIFLIFEGQSSPHLIRKSQDLSN